MVSRRRQKLGAWLRSARWVNSWATTERSLIADRDTVKPKSDRGVENLQAFGEHPVGLPAVPPLDMVEQTTRAGLVDAKRSLVSIVVRGAVSSGSDLQPEHVPEIRQQAPVGQRHGPRDRPAGDPRQCTADPLDVSFQQGVDVQWAASRHDHREAGVRMNRETPRSRPVADDQSIGNRVSAEDRGIGQREVGDSGRPHEAWGARNRSFAVTIIWRSLS